MPAHMLRSVTSMRRAASLLTGRWPWCRQRRRVASMMPRSRSRGCRPLSARRARDAVDDHVVGRSADDGGEAVVVEEVRRRPAALEHLSGHLVELLGGHPRHGGRPVASCISATTLPARRILRVRSRCASSFGRPRAGGLLPSGELLTLQDARGAAALLDHRTPGRSRRRANPYRDRNEQLVLVIPLDERRRLALVELEAAADGLCRVVSRWMTWPPHTSQVQLIIGGLVTSSWPAVDADPPRGQPLQDERGGTSRSKTRSRRSGRSISRAARPGRWSEGTVQDEPPGACVALVDPLPTISMTRSSGSSSPRSIISRALVRAGLALDGGTQHVPGETWDHIVVRQAHALRSLPGPLLAKDHQSDPGYHQAYFRKPS